MRFEGAVVREQGVSFAIVVVKPAVLEDKVLITRTIMFLSPASHGLPIVLLGDDGFGRPKYCGRRDIVDFLTQVPIQAIPWKTYELN